MRNIRSILRVLIHFLLPKIVEHYPYTDCSAFLHPVHFKSLCPNNPSVIPFHFAVSFYYRLMDKYP